MSVKQAEDYSGVVATLLTWLVFCFAEFFLRPGKSYLNVWEEIRPDMFCSSWPFFARSTTGIAIFKVMVGGQKVRSLGVVNVFGMHGLVFVKGKFWVFGGGQFSALSYVYDVYVCDVLAGWLFFDSGGGGSCIRIPIQAWYHITCYKLFISFSACNLNEKFWK